MAAAVLRMGRSDDLLHPPMSVDWPDDHGGGCRLVAECEFHPALTIVAVAERIAEAVVA